MDPKLTLALIVFGAIGIFYYSVILLRRWIWRRIANGLGLNWVSDSFFGTGKIVGEKDGRQVEIKTYTVSSGRSSTYMTSMTVGSDHQCMPLHVGSGYFTNYPDWNCVTTPGEVTQRVFVTHVTLKGQVLIDEKLQPQVTELLGEFVHDYNAAGSRIRRGGMSIEPGHLKWGRSGIVKSTECLEQAMAILVKVAEKVEKKPIIAAEDAD